MNSVMPHLIGMQKWARKTLLPAAAAERVSALNVARTTLAMVVSVLAARACGLPEPFWAVVTTVIVMQSSLGAAWEVSLQRLVGSVIGGGTGAGSVPLLPGQHAIESGIEFRGAQRLGQVLIHPRLHAAVAIALLGHRRQGDDRQAAAPRIRPLASPKGFHHLPSVHLRHSH